MAGPAAGDVAAVADAADPDDDMAIDAYLDDPLENPSGFRRLDAIRRITGRQTRNFLISRERYNLARNIAKASSPEEFNLLYSDNNLNVAIDAREIINGNGSGIYATGMDGNPRDLSRAFTGGNLDESQMQWLSNKSSDLTYIVSAPLEEGGTSSPSLLYNMQVLRFPGGTTMRGLYLAIKFVDMSQ